MRFVSSPNFNARAAGSEIRYVILHYTDMETAQAALEHMIAPVSEVSAHYMLDEDGSLTQLVAEDKRAWHAGKSFWRGDTDINSLSIGIEIVNPGHACGLRPFPDVQIDALLVLLRELFARHSALKPVNVLAHSDIAPLRKKDPGELFPWKRLATAGVGLWPNPTGADEAEPAKPDEAQRLLAAIGYDCPAGDLEKLNAARTAFRRHYVTASLDLETEDQPTLAALRALARMIGA